MIWSTRLFELAASSLERAEGALTALYDDWHPKKPVAGVSGGCLASGTEIRMSDGSKKPISEIEAGEYVLGASLGTSVIEAIRVVETREHVVKDHLSLSLQSGEVLVCSRDQPIITAYGPVRAEHLFPNAVLLDLKDEKFATSEKNVLKDISSCPEQLIVHSLLFDGAFVFFGGKTDAALSCGTIDHGRRKW